MTCHDIQELLSAHLDRALSAEEQTSVVNHLNLCARCRAYEKALLATKEVLRAHLMPSIPQDLVDEIRAKTVLKPRWWPTMDLFRVWAPAIAGVAAAIALWAFLHGHHVVPPGMPPSLPVAQNPQAPAVHAPVALHHETSQESTNDLQ